MPSRLVVPRLAGFRPLEQLLEQQFVSYLRERHVPLAVNMRRAFEIRARARARAVRCHGRIRREVVRVRRRRWALPVSANISLTLPGSSRGKNDLVHFFAFFLGVCCDVVTAMVQTQKEDEQSSSPRRTDNHRAISPAITPDAGEQHRGSLSTDRQKATFRRRRLCWGRNLAV